MGGDFMVVPGPMLAEQPVHPSFARIVAGEGQRPLAQLPVEVGKVACGSLGAPHRIPAMISLLVKEIKAPGRLALELEKPYGAGLANRRGVHR